MSLATEESKIKSSIKKAREFTEKYKKNGQLRSDLKKLTDLTLIHAPSNRWFHSIDELKRMIKLSSEVRIIGPTYGFNFDDLDFECYELYLTTVNPFAKATTKFSTNKTIISEIIPIVDELYHEARKLLQSNNESEADFAENLYAQMLRVLNIETLKNDEILSIMTFLDPRFKNLYFNNSELDRIKQNIFQMSG